MKSSQVKEKQEHKNNQKKTKIVIYGRRCAQFWCDYFLVKCNDKNLDKFPWEMIIPEKKNSIENCGGEF